MSEDRNKEEEIKRKAYSIWEQKGRPEGEHHEHWSQAEKELTEDVAPGKSEKKQTRPDDRVTDFKSIKPLKRKA